MSKIEKNKKISLVSSKTDKLDKFDKVAKVTGVNLSKLSDDELETAFRVAFEDIVVYSNDFGGETDFDVKVVRDTSKNIVKIETTIQGLAGSVNAEDFKKGKVKKADKLSYAIESYAIEKKGITFTLLPKETAYNSSTEYTVVYLVQ